MTRALRWLVALAGGLVSASMLLAPLPFTGADRGYVWLALGAILAVWIGRADDLGALIGRGVLLFGLTFGLVPFAAGIVTGSDAVLRMGTATLGFSTLPIALGYIASRPQDLPHPTRAWIPRALLSIYPGLLLGLAVTAIGDIFFWPGVVAGVALSLFALRLAVDRAGAIGRGLVLAGSATSIATAAGYFSRPTNEAATAFASLAVIFGAGLLVIGIVVLVGAARTRTGPAVATTR